MEISQQKTRMAFLDLARALAILLVIVCHVTETVYPLRLGGIDTHGLLGQIMAFVLFTAGRTGVPLFFFISGYLLLDRVYSEENCIHFWKSNCLHLWVCTVIWWFIYDMILLAQGSKINAPTVLADALFLHKVKMGHVWYMPVILSLYLLVPFAANALKDVKNYILLVPLCIFLLYGFCMPLIKPFAGSLGINDFEIQLPDGFSGGVYGIYLVLGLFLKRGG